MRRLGAHVSIAGGFPRALIRGRDLGCEALQFFLKNARSWRGRPLGEGECLEFRRLREETGIGPLFAHASYLINLASLEDGLYERSIEGFVEELSRAKALGVPYYVIHPGSSGPEIQEGLYRVARALNLALSEVEGVKVLLENTARGLGSRLEHLAAVMEMVEEGERVGVCLDTCHLWAAGYPVGDRLGYEETIRELDDLIGLEKLWLCHLNDSRDPLGSGRDRHEHIGLGRIGEEAFRMFLRDERLAGLSFIIETPKGRTPEGLDWDILNLRRLRELMG